MESSFQAHTGGTSVVTADIVDRLRNETRSIHERLERDLDLLGPQLTAESYPELLTRFYGFYQPFERSARECAIPVITELLQNRWKTGKLAQDLLHFGYNPADVVLSGHIPEWRLTQHLIGALYVTEGATLGGQLIARELERRLGLRNGEGYSFFASYGPQVGSQWRTFRSFVLAFSASKASRDLDDLIVEGAITTFTSMHTWLVAA